MSKKVITISLTDNSIKKAIADVEQFKRELDQKASQLIQRLVDRGVEIAREQVISLGAFDSGDLAGSLDGLMYTDGKHGIIFTKCNHAAFVEFGTGVVGAASPHPTLPWAYDVNQHGEAGWVYYDEVEGRFRWTKGMPSRPFMHNTAAQLEREVLQTAKEVFA